MKATVERATDLWPSAARALLGNERASAIIGRLPGLELVQEVLAA